MKHINITNWQGNITDWTKFNYIYGGLDETIADRVNLSIPGTNLRNYIRKSENLIALQDVAETTTRGITYKVENGSLYLNGTAETGLNLYFDIDELYLNGTFYYKEFTSGTLGTWSRALRYDETNIQNLSNPLNFTISNETVNRVLLYIPTNSTFTNAIIKPMLVTGSTAPTTYEPYGSIVLIENVDKVDLGSLIWNYTAADSLARFWTDNLKTIAKTPPVGWEKGNISTPGYTNHSWNEFTSYELDMDSAIRDDGIVGYRNLQYTTVQAFKTAMSGVYLTYELATPKVTVFNQVDLGTLSWVARKIGSFTDYRMMTSDLSSVIALSASDAVPANISCPKYKTLSANNTYLKNKGISVDGSGSVAVYDENYNQSTSALTFKDSVKDVILIYEARDTSNATKLSMASPMQLDKTNVEEDIEYLEDTKFNEEILSEEE